MDTIKLSPERLEEFKQIYKKQLGKDLTDDEACEIALSFLRLYRTVCRPLPKGHSCPACKPEFGFHT